MSTTLKKVDVAPSSYIKLVRRFPLRPLGSDDEYAAAVKVMEKLAVRGEEDLDGGELDYLNALGEFISLYDRKQFNFTDKRTPLERLRYVLAESGTSRAGLKQILGCSQSLVSMIMNGERELSKANIRALAAHFKVSAGLFL